MADIPIPIPDDIATLTPEQALDAIVAINAALEPVTAAREALQVVATTEGKIAELNAAVLRAQGLLAGAQITPPNYT